MTSAVKYGLPRRALISLAAATATVATSLVVVTSPAAAHESRYCQHSEVFGEHWALWYRGYITNQWGTHFHYVDHSYRPNRNYTYGYRHRHKHDCTPDNQGRMAVAVPPPPPAIWQVESAQPIDYYGVELGGKIYDAQRTVPPPTAPEFVARLQALGAVRVVELRRTSLVGRAPVSAVSIAQPTSAHRVVSVLDAAGGRLEEADLGSTMVVEVANPQLARELGH